MTPTPTGLVVVSRFRPADAAAFQETAGTAVAALATRPGFLGAEVGQNVDDAELWLVVTRWARVGDWRRAMNGYEMKMACTPLFLLALDEPSAFLVL